MLSVTNMTEGDFSMGIHKPQISTWTLLPKWGKLSCSPCQVAKNHLIIQTWDMALTPVPAEGDRDEVGEIDFESQRGTAGTVSQQHF